MELYMYDVRGIQEYIFKTNKVKEIIGASCIVEDIILNIFKEATENNHCSYEYLSGTLRILDDDLDAEVMNYGGGMLLVLFKDNRFAQQVSIKMRKLLFEKTYSLKLAIAHVSVSGENCYQKDYQDLRIAMEKEKRTMNMSTPVSAFPMTMNDPLTGYPLSEMMYGKRVSRESYLKLCEEKQNKDTNFDLEFAGEENKNLIAIVHIDGNMMGNHIQREMANVTNYKEAAIKMREISKEIQECFVETALKNVENNVIKFCKNVGLEISNKIPFRAVIKAGDDITFICNSKIALQCVTCFFESLDQFSACAGIYVTHAHFPFYRAYEYAEELCKNAKKKSRDKNGNYFDFQICTTGSLNKFKEIRKTHYVNMDGDSFIARPYQIPSTQMKQFISLINQLKKHARSKIKSLIPMFYQGNQFVKSQLMMINSRENNENKILIEDHQLNILFDVIEVLDLKWGEGFEK